MAAIRIRGVWHLSLGVYSDDGKLLPRQTGDGQLHIQKASRAGIAGEMHLGEAKIAICGKVKPGSPSVVTVIECDSNGEPTANGLEAILYIPPWWPNVKYQYDLITGTMIVGPSSALKTRELAQKIILVSGIQHFE